MKTGLNRIQTGGAAFSLVELLCVMAIIGILMSLMLPAIFGAYGKIRGQAAEFEAPTIAEYLVTGSRKYCAEHPHYNFPTKQDFVDHCVNNSKVRDWMRDKSTTFVPFNFLDTSNDAVVIAVAVKVGRNKHLDYFFTKADLAVTPQPQ